MKITIYTTRCDGYNDGDRVNPHTETTEYSESDIRDYADDNGEWAYNESDEPTHWVPLPLIDAAVGIITTKHYCHEPSSCPDWQPRTWYSAETYHHPEGWAEEVSAHLDGFDEASSREIYSLITKK